MEALVSNLIKATGWSIFHSLWQGAILYALLLVLFLMVPKGKARLKHDIAYGAISLLFMGFCYTFYAMFTWPPLSTVSATLSPFQATSLSPSIQAERYFPILAGIYGLGLLLQFLYFSMGYYKLWKLKQAIQLTVPPEWQVLFNRIKKDLNIHKNIGFYLSSQVTVPLVIGFFKPLVLFPAAFALQLEIAHVEALLIHELSHIRRNDYLLNLLKTAMETILFFNPFMWLCSKLIEREREHACDDIVIKQTHTPLTYAHALLKIELIKEKQTPVFSMAAGSNNQHLYQRIKRITAMKTNYMNAKQQIFTITLTIVTLISIAWVNPIKSESVVQNKVSTVTAPSTLVLDLQNVTPAILIKKMIVRQDTSKNKKTKRTTVKTRIQPVPTLPNPVNTPEFKKEMEEVRLHFNSPEWKKQQEDIKKMSAEMREQFNSPEWKKQMEDLKNQSLTIAKQFNSPEWKKQIEELKSQSLMIAKQFNSPEFKKQMENRNRLYNSPEYKALESKFQKEVEELKHKKELQAEKNN